ncbi:hypothetical protein Pan216_16310 [Planctomycetes bacterium Pan216]|uniref:Thiol-disulfide oxidoreductase DCC n=1 Tax=Kolteria novifilia TaxID=2527975 RepID=A0A518B1C2_9BACT|nr:hypothetical protein Pan216_16310 [Planctomycetes bacterium Pan216]
MAEDSERTTTQPAIETLLAEHPVLMFDGVCHLCQGSVKFIVKRDPGERFRFVSLQSDLGRRLLVEHGLDPDQLSSVVLLWNGVCSTKSTAALRVAGLLRCPFPLLGVFWILPRFVRDAVYSLIARNRYRWFGRDDACMVPTPELRSRFLDT